MGCILDSGRASHNASYAGSPVRYLCLAGTFPRGPWNYRVVYAQLLYCSLDLFSSIPSNYPSASPIQRVAHNETMISCTVLGLNLDLVGLASCAELSAFCTMRLTSACDSGPSRVTDDLIGLPVGCPQLSCQDVAGTIFVGASICGTPRAQAGYHPIRTLPRRCILEYVARSPN